MKGEMWRQDGTGAPEGWLGEGRGSNAQRDPLSVRGSTGTGRDPRGIGGSEGNMASVSPAHSGPEEPAEVPGLILHTQRPPPAARVLREWEGRGGGGKVEARPDL